MPIPIKSSTFAVDLIRYQIYPCERVIIMDWFTNLFPVGSVAYTIIAYSLTIAIGLALGKIRFKGISLGSTFVLFVGLLLGHFGVSVSHETSHFLKEFGLILFIFFIGLQVGPGFFSSFKEGGVKLNLLSTLFVLLGMGVTIAAHFILQGEVSMPMLVGVMSGAVTNTPGLGAAQEALNQLGSAEPISLGYAVAYPMGVVGTILVILIIRGVFRVNLQAEEKQLTDSKQDNADKPDVMTFRITNPKVDGMTLRELRDSFGHNAIATRVFDGKKVFIPELDTVFHLNDIVRITTRDENAALLTLLLGEVLEEYEWDELNCNLVSRRIVVTKNSINGKTLRQLHLRNSFHVNVTRVNRAGVDLIASPNLALQVGDRVMVVGPIEGINKVESFLGNTLKRLNEPHLFTIFVGILLGILVGGIPIYFPNMPMPTKLGLAGGPLIVAILLGRFGYKLRLITYTTQSANLMLRELGLCLFLASVGLEAGGKFIETVVSPEGALWVGIGLCITMIPGLIVGSIARFMKINYLTICGMIAGSHTNPPSLAYSGTLSETDAPAVAYSTVYPLTMFLRIIIAQCMILFFV